MILTIFAITMLCVLPSSSAFMFTKTPVQSYFNIGIKGLRYYRHKRSVRRELSSSAATARYMEHHMSFFPIYYNDVYEVDLPKGHRFPMEKYRKVRMALQNKIFAIDNEQNVKCGE